MQVAKEWSEKKPPLFRLVNSVFFKKTNVTFLW